MVFDELRTRVVRYAVLLAVVGAAWWGIRTGKPLWQRVERLQADVSRIESRTVTARGEAVRLGGRAMEDSIAAARARFEALRGRVPVGESEAMSAAEIRQVLTALAEREGVEIADDFQEIAPVSEGGFEVAGIRWCVAGPYHGIGSWMAGALSVPRLVQVRGASMRVEPDSVIRVATAALVGPPGVGSGAPRGAAARSWCRKTGEAGEVVAEVSFHWFRQRPSSSSGADSTSADGG